MNLDDKTINAMSAADPAGQAPETVPTKSAKRRKGNGAAARKAKQAAAEAEESIDNSAPLTLASNNGGARQRKKMLFETPEADAPPSIALMGSNGHVAVNPSIFAAAEAATKRKTETAPAATQPTVAGAAAPTVDVESFAKPVVPATPKDAALVVPTSESGPVAEAAPAAPIADMKGSVFQVATLVMRSSETPKAETAQAVASAPEVESPVDFDDDVDLAPAEPIRMAPAPVQPAVEEAVAAAEPPAAKPAPVETVPSAPAAAPADVPEPISRVEDVRPVQPAQVAAAPSPRPEAPASDNSVPVLSRSQAIAARAARMSAQSTPRPAVQPPQPAPAAPRVPEPQRPAELPVQAGDIYGYWTRVKNGRRFPSRSDFDAEQLAEHWPNSMLLTCAKAAGNSPVTFSSVLRLGANRRSRPGEDLSFTSMITEWILSTGGEAARAGKPVQDTEVFPTPEGTHAYKIVALPLSDHQTHVDHVLCHLSRS